MQEKSCRQNKTKMPKLLKIIIGIIIVETIFNFLATAYTGFFFWAVISLGILSGFVTRSSIAWHFARILRLFSIIAGSVILIGIIIMAPIMIYCVPESIMGIIAIFILILFIVCVQFFVFFALGSHSVRKYLNLLS